MAKQNFLSGGYYGKLGMTVGQRWKNIRTIRSYVIPHNPRTEEQQKNRGKFGDCVFYAQVGMQLNYKAPCFNLPNITIWNARMSTARALQDLGLEELERFPLYPVDFAVPYTIASANITEKIDDTHISVTVDGDLPEAERVLTMVLLLPGTEDWKERLAVCVGANSEEDFKTFTFQLPEDLTLSEGMQCRFISCDDVDSTTDLIASSQIEISYTPVDEHEFDTSIRSFTRNGSVFTLTFNEPYQNGTNTVTISRLLCVRNGVQGLVTVPSATLVNNGGYFAMVFDCGETKSQNIWAFPSGSAMQIASISSRSSSVIATAENKSFALSNDDLSRTYDNRISSVTREGDTFTFAYATTAPTSTSGSGNITIHAVSKGVFVDLTTTSFHATKDSITFTQSRTDEEEIYAFPSGSTFTENLTRVSHGVTYSPEYTTAQALSNASDLVRSISSQPSMSLQSGQNIISFQNLNLTSRSASAITLNTKHNKAFFNQTGNYSWQYDIANGAIELYTVDDDSIMFAFKGSYFMGSTSISGIANGVTYQLKAIEYYFDSHLVTKNMSEYILPSMLYNDSFTLYFRGTASAVPDVTACQMSANVRGRTWDTEEEVFDTEFTTNGLNEWYAGGTDFNIGVSIVCDTPLSTEYDGDCYISADNLSFQLTVDGVANEILVTLDSETFSCDIQE